jgi:hypothetical protein
LNSVLALVTSLQESNVTLHKQVELLQRALAAANISTDPSQFNEQNAAGAGIAADFSSLYFMVIAISVVSCIAVAGIAALSRSLYCSCGCNRHPDKENDPQPATGQPPAASQTLPAAPSQPPVLPATGAAGEREPSLETNDAFEMAQLFTRPPNQSPFGQHNGHEESPFSSASHRHAAHQPTPSNSPFAAPSSMDSPFGQPPNKDSPWHDAIPSGVQAEPMPPLPPGARRALTRTNSAEPNPFHQMDM